MNEDPISASDDPWALVVKGLYAEARDRYIKLHTDHEVPAYLHNRGLCALLLGDYAAAMDDFSAAARESGVHQNAGHLIFQAVSHWYLKQPAESVRYLRAGLKASYTDAAGGVQAPALLLYVAERMHDNALREEAVALLRKHGRRKLHGWPGPIVPFLLNKLDMGALETEAQTIPVLHSRRQCQAHFFIALRALQANDLALFAARMTASASQPGVLLEPEYYFARWELEHHFPVQVFTS